MSEKSTLSQGDQSALDAQWAITWLREAAQVFAEHADELSELDRTIGDGDHGENMKRGFSALVQKFDDAPQAPTSLSEVFKLAAMTLLSTVGGAAGPLYGTAFMRMAAQAGEVEALSSEQVVALVNAALEGVVSRGKAEQSDKTMVDAWIPAAEAAKISAAAGAPPAQVLAAAANAAHAGAEATAPLVARKGRASYLGERSVGTKDPGATSSALLLGAAAAAAGASFPGSFSGEQDGNAQGSTQGNAQ